MTLPRHQRHKKQKRGGKRASLPKKAVTSGSISLNAEVTDDASSAATVANDEETDALSPRPGKDLKRRANSGLDREGAEPDSELVFEDPYGDDFESETDDKYAPNATDSRRRQGSATTADEKMVFRPGVDKVPEGETLVCDESAYDIFHKINVEWPSLSFDIVCNNAAGEYTNIDAMPLNTYPLTVSVITGSQADSPSKNKIVCLKMSNLHRSRTSAGGNKGASFGKLDVNKGEDSDSDISDDESDDDLNDDQTVEIEPGVLQSAEIKYDSTVNRLRVMPQRANIVAVWGESGRVSLIDAAPALDAVNRDSKRRMAPPCAVMPSSVRPFFSFGSHRCQGYAMDWSPVTPGRLLTGACNGSIYLWEPSTREASGWSVSTNIFRGQRGSVEDIQWSPSEANVFASCGVDKSIRFWDTRQYRKPALGIATAHDTDVNVISWNRNETHLVLSGGDEGAIRVWDLRALSSTGANPDATPAAEFKQHTAPITSVQWHPKDASMLCASSEDGTVTVWDLAVERDAEEELREGVLVAGAEEFPPQLLFIHMGQKNIKEAHWHPACASLLISTAEDGLNLFKPSNITLPD